jgi:competence protein ComEC
MAAISFGGLVAILVLVWGVNQPDGNLHVAFLDVGQGDAIFIQTPSGRQIVVDGGRYPSVLYQELGRRLPFWDREIDLVIATHPEADHISGLPGLFERYEVGQLLTNGENKETAVSEALNSAAVDQGITIRSVSAGELIVIEDGVHLEVLNPPPLQFFQSSNQNSIAVRLTYGSLSVFLTGDTEMLAEQAMIQSGHTLQSVILKAGHHGSNTSSTAAFLTAVQPQVVVISSGKDNQFGHPHPEMLQRAAEVGAAVLRTDELGTIELISDGQMMWWQADSANLEIRN